MLIGVTQWIETAFSDGSAPTERAVKTWIKQGRIAGIVIGKHFYVDTDGFKKQLEEYKLEVKSPEEPRPWLDEYV